MKVPDRSTVSPELLRKAEELAGQLTKRVQLGMEPILQRTVLPVLARQGRRDPVVCGTGSLLRIAERSFFVTAAHVLKVQADSGIKLHIGVDGDRPRTLNGLYSFREKESHDVGVVELTQDLVEAIESSGRYSFLRLAQVLVLPPRSLPFGGYLLYGYPTASAEVRDDVIYPKFLAYPTRPWDGRVDHLPSSYDPEVHALFYRPELPLEVEGMSGSPLWLVYKASKRLLQPESWSIDWARIVGIQVSEFRNVGIVKMVSWSSVLSLLARCYPDLVPAMNLVHADPRP